MQPLVAPSGITPGTIGFFRGEGLWSNIAKGTESYISHSGLFVRLLRVRWVFDGTTPLAIASRRIGSLTNGSVTADFRVSAR